MHNIDIEDCDYGDRHLFEIHENSMLHFNNGHVKNNSGASPLYYVKEQAYLVFKKVKFSKNIQTKDNFPSCILTEEFSKVIISECKFLDHTSHEYPYSSFLLSIQGHVNINASKFDNNEAFMTQRLSTITVTIKYIILN